MESGAGQGCALSDSTGKGLSQTVLGLVIQESVWTSVPPMHDESEPVTTKASRLSLEMDP